MTDCDLASTVTPSHTHAHTQKTHTPLGTPTVVCSSSASH